MNSDTDPSLLPSDTVIDALNLIIGESGILGARTFPKGTVAVTFTLPAGTNKVIGYFEDKQTGWGYYFLDNSNHVHKILCWQPDEGRIVEVTSGDILSFDQMNRVTGGAVVDAQYLYWTNGRVIDNELLGDEPRKINVVKAIRKDKLLTYIVYADINSAAIFTSGYTYTFTVKNAAGVNQASIVLTANGSNLGNATTGLAWIKAGLVASALNPFLTITECAGCQLEIEMVNAEYTLTFLSSQVLAENEDVLLVPINHYPAIIFAQHISLIKEPPSCPPTVEYFTDSSTAINNVSRKSFQFRVRYIYDDGERSAWGPISLVALNLGVDGLPVEALNAIRIDFSEDKLRYGYWVNMIEKVEVAVREGNNGVWKRIKTLKRCEFGIQTNLIEWSNDAVYEIIPSDDASQGSPDTQVLKLFDEVPLLCAGMTSASGADGDQRVFLADNIEGYDNPDCVEVEFDTVEFAGPDYVDITGTVNILNNVDEPAANPDFAYYALNGFVVYLAGTSYYGVSNNPADGSGDGSFTIKNVPKGKYILRVAGYQVRFDSDLSPRENMNNGLEWQRTSSPMNDCAGSLAATSVATERTIDLRGFGGSTFDLDVEPGYGDIKVYNAHSTSASLSLVEAYLMDGGGGIAQNDFEAAISVERLMATWTYQATDTDQFTDHNGYVWIMLNDGDDEVGITIPGMNSQQVVVNESPVDQGWKEIYDGATGVPNADGFLWVINTGVGANFGFFFNDKTDFTADFRRTLSGQIIGLDGNGIAGVLVAYGRTGRYAMTDYLGMYAIAIYPENDGGPGAKIRTGDELIPTYPNDTFSYDPPVPLTTFPVINPYGNFVANDITLAFSGGLAVNQRFLKNGGRYKMGIVYEDKGNRTAGVVPLGVIDIPFFTDAAQFAKYLVSWSISSQPPSWATHWRMVRSKNLVHQRYFQWMTDEVKFGQITNPNLAPTFGAFSSLTWTHLFIRVNVRDIDPDDNALLLFFNEAEDGYTPQIGDRVRFIYDTDLNPLFPGGILELDVAGYYVDAENYYVVVPRTSLPSAPEAGWTFEFYTPKGVDDQFYYETSDCYPVLQPGQVSARHAGEVDQVLSPPSPATGYLNGGDTYWRMRQFNTVGGGEQIFTENMTPSPWHMEAAEDIGRAFIEAVRGQVWYHNRIRFSGLYVPNSETNGLSSFGALDYQDINRTFGPITWIGYTGNVLLALCMFKTQSLYLGRGRVLDLRGDESVGRSDSIANVADNSISDYGCAHPESVVNENGRVYWWDWYRGTPCRYSQAGTESIADGQYSVFQTIAGVRRNLSRETDLVIGGYDRLLNLYYLTFFDGTYLGPENDPITVTGGTFGFSPQAFARDGLGWISRFSFKPECYGPSATELAGFLNGALWRHNQLLTRNRFYNTAYNPLIKFAVNQDPTSIKTWNCISVKTDRKWAAIAITTPRNYNYNTGMSSRLKVENWKFYEGDWCADFLRDMNDTSAQFLNIVDPLVRAKTALLKGRYLRSHVLIITLEYADTAGAIGTIYHAFTEYTSSQKTGLNG